MERGKIMEIAGYDAEKDRITYMEIHFKDGQARRFINVYLEGGTVDTFAEIMVEFGRVARRARLIDFPKAKPDAHGAEKLRKVLEAHPFYSQPQWFNPWTAVAIFGKYCGETISMSDFFKISRVLVSGGTLEKRFVPDHPEYRLRQTNKS